jgi:hypothetical protein
MPLLKILKEMDVLKVCPMLMRLIEASIPTAFENCPSCLPLEMENVSSSVGTHEPKKRKKQEISSCNRHTLRGGGLGRAR